MWVSLDRLSLTSHNAYLIHYLSYYNKIPHWSNLKKGLFGFLLVVPAILAKKAWCYELPTTDPIVWVDRKWNGDLWVLVLPLSLSCVVFQLSSMVHCVNSIKINLIVRRGLLARVPERISCVHLPGSMWAWHPRQSPVRAQCIWGLTHPETLFCWCHFRAHFSSCPKCTATKGS